MANDKAALDAAIQAEDVTVQLIAANVSKIAADVTALLAKIAAGGNPVDLSTEIQAVQSHAASLQTAADALTASDTAANA